MGVPPSLKRLAVGKEEHDGCASNGGHQEHATVQSILVALFSCDPQNGKGNGKLGEGGRPKIDELVDQLQLSCSDLQKGVDGIIWCPDLNI